MGYQWEMRYELGNTGISMGKSWDVNWKSMGDYLGIV